MTSTEKPEFVLFYMNNCKFCNNFIKKLNSKPELLKKFNLVDIDKIPVVPDEIQEIPALYDGKNILSGKNAFKWLEDKISEYLSPADDGLPYTFIDGSNEQLFNNYSLLDQKNGSFGMGGETIENKDPTRMMTLNNNTNKNNTLEQLMKSRESM